MIFRLQTRKLKELALKGFDVMCEIDIERLEEENRILRIELRNAEQRAKTWRELYERQTELLNRLSDDDDCFED